MTVNDLISSLIEEIEELLKDISFVNAEGKESKIKGYAQELPLQVITAGWEDIQERRTEEELFPYFLVQVSEITYEETEALAKTWILLGIYDDRADMSGSQNMNNAIERLTQRFRVDPVLQGYFYCDRTMKAAYPDEGDWPHFFAGLEMVWHLPLME